MLRKPGLPHPTILPIASGPPKRTQRGYKVLSIPRRARHTLRLFRTIICQQHYLRQRLFITQVNQHMLHNTRTQPTASHRLLLMQTSPTRLLLPLAMRLISLQTSRRMPIRLQEWRLAINPRNSQHQHHPLAPTPSLSAQARLYTIACLAVTTSQPFSLRSPFPSIPPTLMHCLTIPQRVLRERGTPLLRRMILDQANLSLILTVRPNPATSLLKQGGVDTPATKPIPVMPLRHLSSLHSCSISQFLGSFEFLNAADTLIETV